MTGGDDTFYPRVFALVTAALLASALFLILRPFLVPILWSMLLALLLFPAQQALGRRLGGRHALTALCLTLLTAVVLIAPLPLLAVAFASQAKDLFGRGQREDGLEVVARLRQVMPRARFILLTAFANDATRERAHDARVDLVLVKPQPLSVLGRYIAGLATFARLEPT